MLQESHEWVQWNNFRLKSCYIHINVDINNTFRLVFFDNPAQDFRSHAFELRYRKLINAIPLDHPCTVSFYSIHFIILVIQFQVILLTINI